MKVTWKKDTKKRPLLALSKYPNLPFDQQHPEEENARYHNNNNNNSNKDSDVCADKQAVVASQELSDSDSNRQLVESFQAQGDKLAEDGKYREALGKWETALNMMPENAVLHEQKAQVLLEIGDAWNALKAATRATELEPSWAEAWITLGRAQLNFGEPDNAIESFDRALAIKPDLKEGQDDRQTSLHLVKRRKQLHASGLSSNKNRYMVGDKAEGS